MNFTIGLWNIATEPLRPARRLPSLIRRGQYDILNTEIIADLKTINCIRIESALHSQIRQLAR